MRENNIIHFSFLEKKYSVLKNWGRGHMVYAGIQILLGCIAYGMLITQNLTNSYDGLWKNSYFMAGEWERSIGRWFWPFLDIMRFGVVSVVTNSLLTVLLEVLGNMLLIDLFEIKNKRVIFIMGAVFIVSPLTCNMLSYCYMSPTFASAYLLSVGAVCCILKIPNIWLAVLTGGILVACSMGNYQAYLGVTCILLLFFLLKQIMNQCECKEIFKTVMRSAAAVIWGGMLYQFITSLMLKLYSETMTDYKGIDQVSIRNILRNFPKRFMLAYHDFYRFFCTGEIQNNIFGNKKINFCLLVATILFLIYSLYKNHRKNKIYILLFTIGVVLIPAASNVTLFIATESETSLLMTGGMVLIPGLILCMIYSFGYRTILYKIYMFLMCVLLWINICIVGNDQLAMREGRTASVTIAQNILNRLMNEKFLDEDTVVAFVGRPSDNRLFHKTSAWKKANDYAVFGRWWTSTGNNRRSWKGLVQGYCGISLKFCKDTEYNKIREDDRLKEMGVFPAENSIQIINDVVVIKVSDVY